MADRMTSNEIKERVASVVNKIANQTDVAKFGDLMKDHFSHVTYLANLSWNNQMLAIMQGATGEVRTFKGWLSVGRCVRKGESSHIVLIRPNFGKKKDAKDENDTYVYFSGYKVFDVSQTDVVEGAEEITEPIEVDSETQAFDSLVKVCRSMNIDYKEMPLRHGHYGYSAGGRIVIASNLVMTQKISTLAHEIAHEVLHQSLPMDERIAGDRKRFEYEAEMTAAVLMDYFGMPDNPFHASYVKMYGADREKITATMQAVQKAVSNILKAMNVKEEEENDEVEVAA